MNRRSSGSIESGRGGGLTFEAKPKNKSTTSTRPPSARDWLNILPESESNLRPALQEIIGRRKKKKSEVVVGELPQNRGGRRSRTGQVVDRDGKVKSDDGSA